MAKRAKELKLDMEAMLLTNNGMVAGSSGTARETGSVGAWIQSNLENGTAAALRFWYDSSDCGCR